MGIMQKLIQKATSRSAKVMAKEAAKAPRQYAQEQAATDTQFKI